MKKADGWSMGQGEQKKKALEEKLRRRAYTAAFEAAQQRKEKPWQSWDEAFSERLAKQPFITEEERKPFAPSGAGAQNAFTQGKSSRGRAYRGSVAGAGAPGRENPLGGAAENLPDGAGAMLLAGQRRSMAQAAPGGEPPAGPGKRALFCALRAWTRRTATRCMRGRRWRSCCGPSDGRRARRPAKHCSPAGDMMPLKKAGYGKLAGCLFGAAGGAAGADAGAGARTGRRCWRGVHKICPAFAGAGRAGFEHDFARFPQRSRQRAGNRACAGD